MCQKSEPIVLLGEYSGNKQSCHKMLIHLMDVPYHWIRGSVFKQFISAATQRAYCEITGDIGVRIVKEGGGTCCTCVPVVAANGSRPPRLVMASTRRYYRPCQSQPAVLESTHLLLASWNPDHSCRPMDIWRCQFATNKQTKR